ncbi:glycine/betaine ABC transporter substrate-binding protein [Acetobacter sp. TBRC 12305]|uniref:Glycine/betaine ABC transporter substrate-binding protein n=1 Tax=Acetobacter garciniae TaxID=2817435 RepID=A0A939KRD9_9PROT|nr:glycine betaine ABC transporter substrate-binding protein [Acetobacter garciniae]MBO1324956.1 glycine/betaine ABC transporter substrate-binding protein [Acetobacter garciniae]MBX0344647.1 glycine/betaine ABC transporter substrate-binding protein [Acetobacter garciniae]
MRYNAFFRYLFGTAAAPALQHCRRMGRIVLVGLTLLSTLLPTQRAAALPVADTPSCAPIRLSDVGWTDAEAVTSVAVRLFDALGYRPQAPMLTLALTYVSMRDRRVDAFLSNWEPIGHQAIAPFLADGSVEQVATNLSGAHLTLAVPDYTWNAGLRDYKDIQAWGPQLSYMIFGLEAGNNGNALILNMLRHNQFNLGHFRLVESSEQGMLSQVARNIQKHQPILFLGWEPHPMNMTFPIRYLTGGESVFGADGGTSVHTVIRAGYDKACPNAARLLTRIRFSVQDENTMMRAIEENRTKPSTVAWQWLRDHPAEWSAWLEDIVTMDGQPGKDAVKRMLDRTP